MCSVSVFVTALRGAREFGASLALTRRLRSALNGIRGRSQRTLEAVTPRLCVLECGATAVGPSTWCDSCQPGQVFNIIVDVGFAVKREIFTRGRIEVLPCEYFCVCKCLLLSTCFGL